MPVVNGRYVQPKISVGSNVVWSNDPGCDERAAATVVGINNDSISLLVWPPDGGRTGVPKGASRHRSDPALAKLINHEHGCWDYTDETKRLMALEALASKAK